MELANSFEKINQSLNGGVGCLDTIKLVISEIVEHVDSVIEQNNTVVTTENIAEEKKKATELNKLKTTIDDGRKEFVRITSEPINQINDELKAPIIALEKARKEKLDQLKKFEDEKVEEARKLITEYVELRWNNDGIENEFRDVETKDLIKATALTPGGKLNTATKSKIDNRVRANKGSQEQTERRLLMLENQSLKAGLKAPLERPHVEVFLFTDEDVYNERLQRILKSEVARQEKTEEKIQEEIAQRATKKPRGRPAKANVEEIKKPEPAPKPTKPGLIACRVTCEFDLEIPPGLSDDAIEAELRKKMGESGFKTLSKVLVQQFKASA